MWFRAACIAAGLLFLVSAALQLNDPDPIFWTAIYGASALVSLAASRRGELPWWPTAIVGGVALGWMGSILPRVWGRVSLAELFGRFEMKSVAIEEARECVGLALVAIWMWVLGLVLRSRKRTTR